MAKVLVGWVGAADLDAAKLMANAGIGPIAQALETVPCDEATLLVNWPKSQAEPYLEWLRTRTSTKLNPRFVQLSSPTNYGEIWEAAIKVLSGISRPDNDKPQLVFHLSPGTPAMAAVWILLAQTKFPAELIESSQQHGVKRVALPFSIMAEYVPELFQERDEELKRLSTGLPPDASVFADIIHRSEVMKRIILKARRVAMRSVPALIEGESGTGKEQLARAIHNASPRKERPFVPVNCGAIPANLIESTLFGHVKGAFTGAMRDQAGVFEEANGGTLFLDEIGELPKDAQVKFLRVLNSERMGKMEVTRVGSHKPINVDVRIIAATNRRLSEEVSKANFREDLYYRLAVVTLILPPLRDREGDIPLLVGKLLERANEEAAAETGFHHRTLSVGARKLLFRHPWPGNVRELQNALRRLVMWSPDDVIREDDVREALFAVPGCGASQDGVLNRSLAEGIDLQEIMGQVARHYLERAMEQASNNKTQAAKSLGLGNYQTLSNWLEKYKVRF